MVTTPSLFTQATNGEWIHWVTTVPKFPLPPHLQQNPHDHAHFFIVITLSFPKCHPISTYTFIDSGATSSHISNTIVTWHSSIKKAKITPMPIFTINDQPLSSGLLTHDMITQIDIHDHKEVTNLGICSMPYLVLLGLDWLKQHNPAVDWACQQLSLSCCGLSSIVPAFGKGYGLLNPTTTCSTLSIASVGIDYGLNNLEILSVLGNMKNLCSSKSYPAGIFTNLQAISSILCPPIPNNLGHVELKSIWSIPPVISNPEPSNPIDIAFVNPEQFHK